MARRSNRSNPPNCYPVGNSWIVEFEFRGRRYRENVGPVSRTVAREKAQNRKTRVAEGKLAVAGRLWVGREWIEDEQAVPVADTVFEEACEEYLKWYKANRRPTSYLRHFHSAKHLKAMFGAYRLSKISAFLVEKYKMERKAAGATKTTIDHELTMLRHLFSKAIEWKLARTNPVSPGLFFKAGNARTRYLKEDELRALLAACNPDLRLLVLAAVHTGFRKSELRSLTWAAVDLQNRSVTVDSAYAKNHETRTVPLTDDLYAALKDLRDQRECRPEDAVFVSRYGKPWTDWRTAFENALERAGIRDFRWHDLRHCYGSYLGMAGVNQKAMMELMGHRDPKMTLRYTHLSDEYKRQAVGRLPSVGDMKSPQISPSEKKARVIGFSK